MSVTAPAADRIAAGLRTAAADLAAGMPDVNAAIARQLAARVTPPVLTGRLARTVRAVSDAHTAAVTAGGSGVAYAGVQEYGSARHNIRARRYLRAALEAGTAQALDQVAAGVADRLAAVKGA